MQAEPFSAGVRCFDFDQSLAPYNLHAYQQWQNLSGYISKQTISKLAPLPHGNISITAEADPAHLKPVTPAEKQLYAQLLEGRSDSTKSSEIMVTDISTQCSASLHRVNAAPLSVSIMAHLAYVVMPSASHLQPRKAVVLEQPPS